MTEDESRSANALFVEKKGILQKIVEASKETLQDHLFIKNWILMTIGTLFQQILMTVVSIEYRREDMLRLDCPKCQLTTCALCAKNYLGKTVNVKGKQHQKLEEEKDFSNNKVKLLKELLKEKTEQVQQMIRDQAKEYHENKSVMQKKEELWQSKERLLIKDLTDALKIINQLKTEQIQLEEQKDEEIRELKSQMQKEKEKQTQDQEEFSPLKIS
ncbi:hypothetical protein Tco_1040710 [Tanacetum coccineum]